MSSTRWCQRILLLCWAVMRRVGSGVDWSCTRRVWHPILLSGAGDGGLPRRRLELAGVDSGVIVEEDRSRNTRENAEYSVAWMREQGFESAVIVTSWWHSRRALACFRKFGPDMEWSSVPSYPGVSMDGKPSVQEAVFIFQEYVKVALYPVLHGVWAWETHFKWRNRWKMKCRSWRTGEAYWSCQGEHLTCEKEGSHYRRYGTGRIVSGRTAPREGV
jgi:hypothetical protein